MSSGVRPAAASRVVSDTLVYTFLLLERNGWIDVDIDVKYKQERTRGLQRRS